jgi:hypothetical protein
MIADVGPEFDFLGFDAVLTSLGLLDLFVALEYELAIVHDLADRRPGVWGDLHQVEAALASQFPGLVSLDDADLLAVCVDDPDRCEADSLVDPMIRLWGWFSEEFFSSSDT